MTVLVLQLEGQWLVTKFYFFTYDCRLTFWLSNCVMLRAIVNEAFGEERLPVSAGPSVDRIGSKKGMNNRPSALNWQVSSPGKIGNRCGLGKSFEDWEDPLTLLRALEKVEFWIFSRIVESVWWQVLPFLCCPSLSLTLLWICWFEGSDRINFFFCVLTDSNSTYAVFSGSSNR